MRVMSSMVSLPNHTFSWAGLVLLTSTCAHLFARNWQLPFLNQQEGENDCIIYFMINLYKKTLLALAGIDPTTSYHWWDVHPTESKSLSAGLFVLRFYGPVNPMGSCRARSVLVQVKNINEVNQKRPQSQTKYSFPEAPKDEEIGNKLWQDTMVQWQ